MLALLLLVLSLRRCGCVLRPRSPNILRSRHRRRRPDASVEGRDDDGITGATKILGLIADPVAQARSPAMANAMLERRERLGEYVLVPMHVAADGLADYVAALQPHAQLRRRDRVDAAQDRHHGTAGRTDRRSAVVGAVNVVPRRAKVGSSARSSTAKVSSGDCSTQDIRRPHALPSRGAGGAASAIAFASPNRAVHRSVSSIEPSESGGARRSRVLRAFPAVDVQMDAAPHGAHTTSQ